MVWDPWGPLGVQTRGHAGYACGITWGIVAHASGVLSLNGRPQACMATWDRTGGGFSTPMGAEEPWGTGCRGVGLAAEEVVMAVGAARAMCGVDSQPQTPRAVWPAKLGKEEAGDENGRAGVVVMAAVARAERTTKRSGPVWWQRHAQGPRLPSPRESSSKRSRRPWRTAGRWYRRGPRSRSSVGLGVVVERQGPWVVAGRRGPQGRWWTSPSRWVSKPPSQRGRRPRQGRGRSWLTQCARSSRWRSPSSWCQVWRASVKVSPEASARRWQRESAVVTGGGASGPRPPRIRGGRQGSYWP